MMRPSYHSLSRSLRFTSPSSPFSSIASHQPFSSFSRTANIGFLGLGRMGSEMAFNLFSKHHLNHKNNKASSSTQLEPTYVVCDAVPETAQAFARNFLSQFPGARIRIVDTPEQVALASQTIITMLPSSPQMKEVYTGEHGVLSALDFLSRGLGPELEGTVMDPGTGTRTGTGTGTGTGKGIGREDHHTQHHHQHTVGTSTSTSAKTSAQQVQQTLCIDSTTLDVEIAREVASQVRNAGAQMVDAPVSGGVLGAKLSTLTFLVGSPPTTYPLTLPHLSLMGNKIIHCGSPGTGLAAKLANNLMLGVQQVVTAEAMLLGMKLGVKPGVLVEVVMNSTGGCWAVGKNNPVVGALGEAAEIRERERERKREEGAAKMRVGSASKEALESVVVVKEKVEVPSPPCERDFEGGFALALMLKDMKLASESANRTGTPLPMGTAAQEIYERVMNERPEVAKKDFSVVYKYLEGKKMSKE